MISGTNSAPLSCMARGCVGCGTGPILYTWMAVKRAHGGNNNSPNRLARDSRIALEQRPAFKVRLCLLLPNKLLSKAGYLFFSGLA